MTPEQRDIAMKPMNKAKKDDTEDIPNEEEKGKVKIPDGPVDRPEEEHPRITQRFAVSLISDCNTISFRN